MKEAHVSVCTDQPTPRGMHAELAGHEAEAVRLAARDIGADEGDRLVEHLAQSSGNFVDGRVVVAAEGKVCAARVAVKDRSDLSRML